jgi:hypothetical protein
MDKLKKFNFNENILNPLNENVLKPIKTGDLRAILLYVAIPALIFAIIIAITATLILRKKNASVDRRLRAEPRAIQEKSGKYFEFSFGPDGKYKIYKIVHGAKTEYRLDGFDFFFNKGEEKEIVLNPDVVNGERSFRISINGQDLSFKFVPQQVKFDQVYEDFDSGQEVRRSLNSFRTLREILENDKVILGSQNEFIVDQSEILSGRKLIDQRVELLNQKIKSGPTNDDRKKFRGQDDGNSNKNKRKEELTAAEQERFKKRLSENDIKILKENISHPVRVANLTNNDEHNPHQIIDPNALQAKHGEFVQKWNELKSTIVTKNTGVNDIEKKRLNVQEMLEEFFDSDEENLSGGSVGTNATHKTGMSRASRISRANGNPLIKLLVPSTSVNKNRTTAQNAAAAMKKKLPEGSHHHSDSSNDSSFDESESNNQSLLTRLSNAMNKDFTKIVDIDGIQIYITNTDNRFFINFNGQDKELAGFKELNGGFYQFAIDGIWYLYNVNTQKFQKSENVKWVDFSNDSMKNLICGQVNNSTNLNVASGVFADERSATTVETIHVNSSSAPLSTATGTVVIPIAPPLPPAQTSNIAAEGSVSSSTVDTANAAAKRTMESNLLHQISAGNFKLNNVKSQAKNDNPAKSAQPVSRKKSDGKKPDTAFLDGLNKLRDVIDPSKADFSSENNAKTPLGQVQDGTGISALLKNPNQTLSESSSAESSNSEWLDQSK